MSILFLAVTIERLVNFRPLWAAQEFGKLQQLLADQDCTLARVIAYVVAHRHHGYAVVSSGAGDVASIELRHQQQKAYALAIVATVAPIVGLLGTVVGMIEVFHWRVSASLPPGWHGGVFAPNLSVIRLY